MMRKEKGNVSDRFGNEMCASANERFTERRAA
jgi:hypothetical protein